MNRRIVDTASAPCGVDGEADGRHGHEVEVHAGLALGHPLLRLRRRAERRDGRMRPHVALHRRAVRRTECDQLRFEVWIITVEEEHAVKRFK